MTDESSVDALINRLVNATDKQEKLALYNEWASAYDRDLTRKGYVAPENTVSLLDKHHPDRNAHIYDAGCGTGRVGGCLAKLGYTRITGEDFSESMLEIARLSGHYQSLDTADYTQAIDHPDNCFDASVCVGVYSQEFKNIFLDELIRIVNPGGHIVFSCRPVHYVDGAKPEIESLVNCGRVSLESLTNDPYMREHDANAWFAVMRVS